MKNITKINKIIETIGSGPLYCTLEDQEEYYCKRSTRLQAPHTDLINEVLLNYIFRFSNVPIPIIDIATLEYHQFERQLAEMYEELKDKHVFFKIKHPLKANHFNIPLFASQEIRYNSYIYDLGIEKLDVRPYLNPIDIVKIGFIDDWVMNTDRSPKNTNLLSTLSAEPHKLALVPIDHCRAFGNVGDYTTFIPQKKYKTGFNILESNFGRLLLSSIKKEDLQHFFDVEINSYIRQAELFVTETKQFVPDEWQFDENQMNAITEILTHARRNATLIKNFRNTYIKPIRNDV